MLHILTTLTHTKHKAPRYKTHNTVRKSELAIDLFSLQNKCHRI